MDDVAPAPPREDEVDLDEFEEAAKTRLRVLHLLDEAYISGAREVHLDRIAAGLFAPRDPGDPVAAAAAARLERLSVAATRMAFREPESSRRWLAEQEAILHAARARLGEVRVPPPPPHPPTADEAGSKPPSRRTPPLPPPPPPPPPSGHRWIEFERAPRAIARRDVVLRRGLALVPDALMPEVMAHDHRAATLRALSATAARAEAKTAARGGAAAAFGTPALASVLRALALWRPPRTGADGSGSDLEKNQLGVAGGSSGGVRDACGGVPGAGDAARGYADEACVGADPTAASAPGPGRVGWRRGWRKRARGDKNAAPASSLNNRCHPGAADASSEHPAAARFRLPGAYAAGEDDGGGFFPAASVSLGADARRALRVLRRGPKAASASSRAYPPCVRETLAALHRDRHLRHDARHRLTLFFKGIDMSAEETLAVWRSQLAHGRMTDFAREHRYHVRHAYGLEGKMADYPPHTCERLARSANPGEPAACPFARAARERGGAGERGERGGASSLRAALASAAAPADVEDIASAAERGAPRAACARYFAATHGGGCGGGGGGTSGGGSGGGSGGSGGGGALADLSGLKFPHDYYDASAALEEEARRGRAGGGGEGEGRGGAGGASRPHLQLELEDSSESEEDEG